MSTNQSRDKLAVSTRILYDELIQRNVPTSIISATSDLIEYTDVRGNAHLLFNTCSDKSSAVGKVIADNKLKTERIAQSMNILMPASIICRDIREARKFLEAHHQIVIKPPLGSGGKGVSTNISTEQELISAYTYAKDYGRQVIVQQHISGADVRLLVIDGIFCSAVIRKPAHVIGDGAMTIEALIMKENSDIARNDNSRSSLMHIDIRSARRFLGSALTTIPAYNEMRRVVGPANVSLGGSLHEATKDVTPQMIQEAESITNRLGLGICGIDMMWNRTTNRHYLIEVNAAPGIDIHNDPYSDTKSDCVERYVDWLIA